MERLKVMFFVLLISCISNACWEKVDFENLKILNKSDGSIYVAISNTDEIFDFSKFLLLQRIKSGEDIKEIDLTDLYLSEIIAKGETVKVPRPMVWDEYIDKAKDKRIRIFIIEKDSVSKYGWKYINDNIIYNKKYTFTLDDLKEMEWELVYK